MTNFFYLFKNFYTTFKNGEIFCSGPSSHSNPQDKSFLGVWAENYIYGTETSTLLLINIEQYNENFESIKNILAQNQTPIFKTNKNYDVFIRIERAFVFFQTSKIFTEIKKFNFTYVVIFNRILDKVQLENYIHSTQYLYISPENRTNISVLYKTIEQSELVEHNSNPQLNLKLFVTKKDKDNIILNNGFVSRRYFEVLQFLAFQSFNIQNIGYLSIYIIYFQHKYILPHFNEFKKGASSLVSSNN